LDDYYYVFGGADLKVFWKPLPKPSSSFLALSVADSSSSFSLIIGKFEADALWLTTAAPIYKVDFTK
jgi:hypothetical protein